MNRAIAKTRGGRLTDFFGSLGLGQANARNARKLRKDMADVLNKVKKLEYTQRSAAKKQIDYRDDFKQVRKQPARLGRHLEILEEKQHHQMYPHLVRQKTVNTANPSLSEAILEILDVAGVEHRTFVDIGCGRSGGNSHVLASSFGWSGLMVDSSEVAVDRVTRVYRHNPNFSAECCMVTPENINELIARHGLNDLDFFSLDIDSYDYWVFKALELRPRVVSIEYNTYLGETPLAVPLGGITRETPKHYRGASLSALDKLATEKGLQAGRM